MLESVFQALQGVFSHKLRSFLTMLGIIIGIASIITIVSTIKGTNEQIKESLVGAGNNAVVVQLYQDNYPYDLQWGGTPAGVYPITEETRQKLLELDHVKEVSLYCSRSWADGVYYGDNRFSGGVLGIDRHYFAVNGWHLSSGRGFLEEDYSRFRKVCLLDEKASSSLFAGKDPINATLEIQGESYIVVGVMQRSSAATVEIRTIRDYYTFADTSGGTIFLPLSVWPVTYRYDEPQSVALQADSRRNGRTGRKRGMTIIGKSKGAPAI